MIEQLVIALILTVFPVQDVPVADPPIEEVASGGTELKESVSETEPDLDRDLLLVRRPVIEAMSFVQVPGPNPILTPSESGWDDGVLESSDAFEHDGTYHFYYHATGDGAGYRLGAATANHPLGPFERHGDAPLVDVGAPGSWDDKHVACAYVMQDDDGRWLLWYSGMKSGVTGRWSIGLATADHPLGPWTKHEGNPVFEDFGYLGGVVKVDDVYRLYSAHPINNSAWAEFPEGHERSLSYHIDYSPLALATAPAPEGPWTRHEANPLMEQGEPGEWDEGGISEAEVLYDNGMYHMFYGATHRVGPRTESIGYAYSFDGVEWFKHGSNPVASRFNEPNAAAYAEVHAIIEDDFIYLYHTLRYEEHGGESYPMVEDLGVQVLARKTPFSLDMPVLQLDELTPGASSSIDASRTVCLGSVDRASATISCRFGVSLGSLEVGVRGSSDGITFDTVDIETVTLRPVNGRLEQQRTISLPADVRFIRFVASSDSLRTISDIDVRVALSSGRDPESSDADR